MSEQPKEQRTDVANLREQRRREMAETSFQRNANGGAMLLPSNGRELLDMANMMAASGLMVRDFYRDNPGACAALIMVCAPYGMNPILASWKTYRASRADDAPISFEAQFINAMINQSAPIVGRLIPEYEGEGPDLVCILRPVDRASGKVLEYRSPRLADIPVKNSPLWKGDPRQQIFFYSSRAWSRRYFPELLLGIYSRDEVDDAAPRDVTPAEPKRQENRFAALANQARHEAEASTIEAQAQDPEEVAARLAEDGAPGSSSFDAGVAAFQSGKEITDCPHGFEGPDAADWFYGFLGARKADGVAE